MANNVGLAALQADLVTRSGQCQCAFREVLAGDTAKLGSYSLSNAVGINGGSSNGWGDNWVRGFGDQDDDAE